MIENQVKSLYGLSSQNIDAVNSVFKNFKGIEKVILYGSRARGNFQNGSDIDLTLMGNLDLSTLFQIELELDELYLPYKIDLSLYDQINNPSLLDHISRIGVTFYEKVR